MVFQNGFAIPGFNAALNAAPNGVLGGVATPAGSVLADGKFTPSQTFGFTSDYSFQQRSPVLNSDTKVGVREMQLVGVGIPANNLGLKPWLIPIALAPPQKIPVPYIDSTVGVDFGKFFQGGFRVKAP